MPADAIDNAKRLAAAKAVEFTRPGMRLGLGTGSTAKHFVDLIGERVAAGLDVVCVPTSEATRAQAERLNIPLTTLDLTPELDLTVDGADEFDPAFNLIKGGGGALLREKIVANASARMIVITDRSKQVSTLGRFPLPVEIVPFGMAATRHQVIEAAGAVNCVGPVDLRHTSEGHVFVTDCGHYILDCAFGAIEDPLRLAEALIQLPGVVESGLFIGMASIIIVADPRGVEILGRV